MTKTHKNNKNKYKNKTYKNKPNKPNKQNKQTETLVNLIPFEKDFEQNLNKKQLITSNKQVVQKFVKQLFAPFAPSSIKQSSNFYKYINYLWLKNTNVPETQKYITQLDNFRIVQDKVYHQLKEIIDDYVKNNNNKTSRNLNNYYKSILQYNPVKDSIRHAKEYTILLDELRKDKKNLWKLLANVNKYEIVGTFAPFYWTIKPDEKNSDVFACYLEPHSFNIIDFKVYIDDGTDVKYKEKYRRELKKTYKAVFYFMLGPNNINVDTIYDIEIKFFNSLVCSNKNIDDKDFNSYNRIYKNEAMEKYGFNWEEFCKELGFTKIPEFFICRNLNYLKCCTDLLLKEWNSEEWRAYWLLIVYRRLARITKSSREIFFNFFGKFQRGQETALYTHFNDANVIYLSYPFNSLLTKEYVKKYYDAKKVEYIKVLSEELKFVFIRIIKRNNWLSKKTQKYAIEKLENIKFTFVQPSNVLNDPDLDYYPNDLDKNMKTIGMWRHNLFMNLVGKKIIDYPVMDWTQYPAKLTGSQAYVVNASYTPITNSIYIPLGYIQEPFIDLNERGIEYNLANVGFTIAHELSHSLDEWGRKYNKEGNLDNWWSDIDIKHYKNIQNDIITQYETFAERDGIKFDASLSIGEDVADISGLAICEEYLRDYQEKTDMLPPNRAHSFQQFYTYYTIQMRQIIPKKALKAQLNTNPHPLDVYRCNVPLSRSEIFRALYNVKKGDGMWWHNTNTIW